MLFQLVQHLLVLTFYSPLPSPAHVFFIGHPMERLSMQLFNVQTDFLMYVSLMLYITNLNVSCTGNPDCGVKG